MSRRRDFDAALLAVANCTADPDGLPELVDALDAARACLETWRELLAVDRGGLEDVHV